MTRPYFYPPIVALLWAAACVAHDESRTPEQHVFLSAKNASWQCKIKARKSLDIGNTHSYDKEILLHTQHYVLACPLAGESERHTHHLEIIPAASLGKQQDQAWRQARASVAQCRRKALTDPFSAKFEDVATCAYSQDVLDSGCVTRGICPNEGMWSQSFPLLYERSVPEARLKQTSFVTEQKARRNELQTISGPYILSVQGFRYTCDLRHLYPVIVGDTVSIRPRAAVGKHGEFVCPQESMSFLPS